MARMNAEAALRLYEDAKSIRSGHEDDWRKAAAYCLPQQYASWQTEGPSAFTQKGAATRRIAYDGTGLRSLPKYVSILERIATPSGQKWHGLTASDPNLRKKARVRRYFDELTALLFKYRYNPAARFRIATNEMYGALGVYGNAPIFIGQRPITARNRTNGFKYVACPMRDTFILTDDDGEIWGVFRRFWLNYRQFQVKFPNEAPPPALRQEAGKPTPNEQAYVEFVHFVCPRDDFDPEAIDTRRHSIVGSYIAVKDKTYIGDEQGFASLPYKIPRVSTVAGDPYGYSPAVQALPALGGASATKKVYIKQGNRAADPTLLAHDDNVMNGDVDLRPGAVNYGGVNRDGKPLIQPLRGGDFRVAEALLQDDRGDAEDSFFVTLFQILNETPEMTATEVMERVAEKAALLSPTMGRLQSEFLGPDIEREVELLAELGKLPEMPQELVEAEGEYEVVYTSPMAKSMYAEDVSGFMRAVEFALNTSQATQDPSHLDHFNFEEAIPEIADYMAVPTRWMNDKDTVSQKRTQRNEATQQEQLMQNAPALASAAKTAAEMGGQ